MASFQERAIGAIRLVPETFEEIERDSGALSQAAIVVVASAVAGLIGARAGTGTLGAVGALFAILFSLIGWAIGAALVWFVGTRVLPGKNTEADYQQVLRVVGFAQAPGIFSILGIIPFLGYLVRFVVWIWTLVALVIAVRQVLDYDDTVKAVIVCVIAWAVILVFTMLVTLLGLGAAVAAGSM